MYKLVRMRSIKLLIRKTASIWLHVEIGSVKYINPV
jgi:hypothetical protein